MSTYNRLRIVIRDGKRSTYRYRKDLAGFGFRYDQRMKGWVLTDEFDRFEEKNLRHYCKKRKLKIEVTGEGLVRNKRYRNDFFQEYGRDKFLCAYCGRRLSASAVTVDHIIPIGIFKNKKKARRLSILGIESINDTKNLAPACERCNSKKGMKTGLWVVRGFIGKDYGRRLVMNWTKIFLIIAILLIFFTFFMKVIDTM